MKILVYSFSFLKKWRAYSLFHLMCAHASTRTTGLMCVKYSTHHLCMWLILLVNFSFIQIGITSWKLINTLKYLEYISCLELCLKVYQIDVLKFLKVSSFIIFCAPFKNNRGVANHRNLGVLLGSWWWESQPN